MNFGEQKLERSFREKIPEELEKIDKDANMNDDNLDSQEENKYSEDSDGEEKYDIEVDEGDG